MTKIEDGRIRRLGGVEEFFWRKNRITPAHLVVAAQVSGAASAERWRSAFDAVQQRHPLLRAGIAADEAGTPYWEYRDARPIDVSFIDDDGGFSLDRGIAEELSRPLENGAFPLARGVVARRTTGATLIVTLDHSVGDGIGAMHLVRDILAALSGEQLEPLPFPSAQEETQIGAGAEMAAAATPMARRPRPLESSTPYAESLALSPELGAALMTACHLNKTTVHGALVAAIAIEGAARGADMLDQPIRVMSPVNIRAMIGRADELVPSLVFPTDDIELRESPDFWAIARAVNETTSAIRTVDGLAASFAGLQSFLSSKPTDRDMEDFLVHLFAYDHAVSNLGVIPFSQDFGDFKMDAFYGPAAFVGTEREQFVSAATIGTTIHLLNSSRNPIPGLLDGVETRLASLAGS